MVSADLFDRVGVNDVIETLLPAGAKSAEVLGDLADVSLFPAEEVLVAGSVMARRREFTTARACARRALLELGFAPAPLLKGDGGAPAWPPGVVGSITHCDGYRACAVAWGHDVPTIGIDAEPALPLPDGVLGLVALPEEQLVLSRLFDVSPNVCWDRLLFCAKEAVYKAWFPLTRRWLSFGDASIELRRDGTFLATLLVPTPSRFLNGLSGRWLGCRGLVVVAVAGLEHGAIA